MARSKIIKLLILLLSILLYFIYGNYLLIILLTSIFTYLLGNIITKNKNFFLIVITYLIVLLPFIFFKYIINITNLNLLQPLGISYYTLSLISYISDIYHNKYDKCHDLSDFLVFSMYFPCLFIGPINRYNDFYKEINKISFKKNNVYPSLLRIEIGLIKKFVIANHLMIIINTVATNLNYNGLYVLFSLFIYSIMLYNDFSGGIDIVLGISKLFNMDLIENFNHPFKSESIKEFWNRWHMSLGNFLKDYIYIPLGGNRVSKIKNKINIIITFLVSGLWHGIHYLLWGFINGILVILNIKTKNKYVNYFLVFIFISILWIFFIYNDTFLSIKMFISIFKDFNLSNFNILNLGLNIYHYLIIVLSLAIIILYENKNILKNINNLYSKIIILLLIIFMVLLFGRYGINVNANNFIYGGF